MLSAFVSQLSKSLTGFEVQPLPEEETYVFTHVASGARFQVCVCVCIKAGGGGEGREGSL